MVQCLALLSHTKKLLGSNLMGNWGLSDMQTDFSKLPIGVNLNVLVIGSPGCSLPLTQSDHVCTNVHTLCKSV